jgi:hypothetical protein
MIYEFLTPSAPELEADRVMFRCPIHGHVCLMDGSVQQVGRDAHDRLTSKGDALYLKFTQPAAAEPPRAGGAEPTRAEPLRPSDQAPATPSSQSTPIQPAP